MIWVGTNNSSDEDEEEQEMYDFGGEKENTVEKVDSFTNSQRLWKPGKINTLAISRQNKK